MLVNWKKNINLVGYLYKLIWNFEKLSRDVLWAWGEILGLERETKGGEMKGVALRKILS